MAIPLLQYKGLNARKQVAISSYLELYMVSLKNYLFARHLFHLNSSLLQMIIVLHPSRIRHNGDTGADVQQGPAPRILFRLRPCVNLFYCLLLITSPSFLYSRGGGWHLGMWPRQNFCTYLDTRGFFNKECCFARTHKDRTP